ncbi:MAG: Flp pilus assembly complex ATPase component TadA [Planctomycetaceae bacterium]|nr:Flp pilus assembly complex ATPase component TadA [Planctomycetaceae bacterium]
MSLLARKPRLGDLLVDRGYISAEVLQSALAEQKTNGGRSLLGEVLVERGLCSEEHVLECLATELGLPYARLDNRLFDPKVFDSLPRDFIEKNTVLPLFRVRDELAVAIAEPTNVFLLDRLRDASRCEILPVVAAAKDIRRMVQTYLPNTRVFVIDDIIDDAGTASVELIEEEVADIAADAESAGQSPIIRLVNYILFTAIREKASDVHIEPSERQLRVRLRVDGALHKALELPPHLAPAVASRIKIMANLDISERRLPQDGRIQVLMEGRMIDLRVSLLPMPSGEKVVIRLLDNQTVRVDLRELGFSAEILEPLREEIGQPNGIALVTGPTGSGKSTTLYAALAAVSGMERNVCTVEDPVEFHLDLINQFQANEKIGLTFATILRSLLRQDPDVIMVGEIRDSETARIAVQAALTGHLVFSTLHTNSACAAVSRLNDMGVEGYLIGASLNMVLAQRLCRRICPKCKEPYEPPKGMRLAADAMGVEIDEFFRGAGCRHCRGTGFSGRIGIHELLRVDEPLRELISRTPNVKAIEDYAKSQGMAPLRYDGLRKVREGITTIDEVLRVSSEGWVPVRK